MTRSSEEFIRRFLLHVLPEGFQRRRHDGLLSNRSRGEKLARCRRLLEAAAPPGPSGAPTPQACAPGEAPERWGRPCPACGTGRLRRVQALAPGTAPVRVGAVRTGIARGAAVHLDTG
jgi:hypothetical protein